MALLTKKLVLTTGEVTTSLEDYVLDLFRLYLTVFEGDIPHAPRLGFNFNLAGVMKDALKSEVSSRVNSLVDRVRSSVSDKDITLQIDSIDLIDEELVKIKLEINGELTDDILVNINNNV